MNWRVTKMCDNCPFRPDGDAIALAPGRLDSIKEGAVLGQPFHCHKTVYGKRLRRRPRRLWAECAGALAYRQRVWREDQAAASRILQKWIAEATDARAERG